MSSVINLLDADALLETIATKIPARLRPNVVVIGSIAAAWAYREISGTSTVATKDIDLLLRPAVNAVATATALGQQLLAEGWQPQFTHGREPGNTNTPDGELPALRLTPPGGRDGWFVELLAEPPQAQVSRKHWRRFETAGGVFGLPSFRYMPVAVHDAEQTRHGGLLVARPACMALANLLEHADPDRNPMSDREGKYLRFQKDVGRAVALWWLAGRQDVTSDAQWRAAWDGALGAFDPGNQLWLRGEARKGLESLDGYLREAHEISRNSVLAAHGATLEAYKRAYAGLGSLLDTH